MFMKKLHHALNVFSCFQTHEKEVHPDLKKKTRQGLFFNLRLRKASKPLRERV